VLGWDYDGAAIEIMPAVNYFAYGCRRYGVKVSCGDMDGDGHEEILTGPGPGGFLGAHVKGWEVIGGRAWLMPGMSFLAYASRYGVNVSGGAAGDDGRSVLLTGPGPGPCNSSVVSVWEYRDRVMSRTGSFFAFDDRYGVIPAVHTCWH